MEVIFGVLGVSHFFCRVKSTIINSRAFHGFIRPGGKTVGMYKTLQTPPQYARRAGYYSLSTLRRYRTSNIPWWNIIMSSRAARFQNKLRFPNSCGYHPGFWFLWPEFESISEWPLETLLAPAPVMLELRSFLKGGDQGTMVAWVIHSLQIQTLGRVIKRERLKIQIVLLRQQQNLYTKLAVV
jgi:hypothetical protein